MATSREVTPRGDVKTPRSARDEPMTPRSARGEAKTPRSTREKTPRGEVKPPMPPSSAPRGIAAAGVAQHLGSDDAIFLQVPSSDALELVDVVQSMRERVLAVQADNAICHQERAQAEVDHASHVRVMQAKIDELEGRLSAVELEKEALASRGRDVEVDRYEQAQARVRGLEQEVEIMRRERDGRATAEQEARQDAEAKAAQVARLSAESERNAKRAGEALEEVSR